MKTQMSESQVHVDTLSHHDLIQIINIIITVRNSDLQKFSFQDSKQVKFYFIMSIQSSNLPAREGWSRLMLSQQLCPISWCCNQPTTRFLLRQPVVLEVRPLRDPSRLFSLSIHCLCPSLKLKEVNKLMSKLSQCLMSLMDYL